MESLEGGCVIVANGRFPSAELPLRLLKEAKTIIACDGAVKTLYERVFIRTLSQETWTAYPPACANATQTESIMQRTKRSTTSPNPSVSPIPKAIEKFSYQELPDCVRIIHWEIYPFLWTMPTYSSGWRCYPTMAFSLLSQKQQPSLLIRDNKSPFSFFIPKGRLVRKDSVGPFADESSPHGGKELSTRLWETNSLSLSPRIAG